MLSLSVPCNCFSAWCSRSAPCPTIGNVDWNAMIWPPDSERRESAPPRAEPRAEVATGCSEYIRGIERRSGSKTCLHVSVFVSTCRRERRGCIPGFGWISKKITATWRVDFVDIWYYSDG